MPLGIDTDHVPLARLPDFPCQRFELGQRVDRTVIDIIFSSIPAHTADQLPEPCD